MLFKEKLGSIIVSAVLGFGALPSAIQAKPSSKSRALIGCTPKQTICAIRTKTGLIGDKVTFHVPSHKKNKKGAVAKGVIISVKGQKGDIQKALVRIEWGHGDIPHKAVPKPPTSPVSSWNSSFTQND
ncbi:MAG: hypothetical protein AB8C84_13255 [Oligoflexales bacterium]